MKKIVKKTLYFFFRDKSYVLIRRLSYYREKCEKFKKVRHYHKRRPFIIEEKSHKKKITVLFFVYKLNMWRYDGLIKLMHHHPRFTPVIVPFVRPNECDDKGRENRDEIYAYFTTKGIFVRDGFNFETGQYLNITDINPDIVIYTQPYNKGFTGWSIDNYAHNCLFIYTPYGISTSENRESKDTYLTNIAWKIFVSCQLEKKKYEDSMATNKNSLVITGATILDDIANADKQKSPWRNNNKKRLIWAPHHSIDCLYGFSNSNFERICFDMLEIAKRYQDQIEIAFKPHPTLHRRLCEKWGEEKTNVYYTQWNKLPNTILCEGRYTELFAYSDAMIHDCASFVYEYLCTCKPVMFICKDENLLPPAGIGNDLGMECFKYHYHGYSMQDIDNFIMNIVIEGHDTMNMQRERFIQKQVFAPNGKSVAENMLHEIEMELFHKTI